MGWWLLWKILSKKENQLSDYPQIDEIRAVSDRVTAIRRGKSIETVEIAGATNADLAEMI